MKHSASALIAAAKRDAPRPGLEGEILGAIGAGAAALAPSFGAKLWLALKHAAVSKAGIATIAFTAAAGGYTAGRLQERSIHERDAAQTQTLTLTPTHTLTPAPTPTPTPTPARTIAPARVVEEAVAATSTPAIASTVTSSKPIATVTEAPTIPAPPPPPNVSLAEEVAAIQRARSAILSKNPRTALAALDDYDRAHPNGVMTEEALALRVRAARLAGDDIGAAEALTKLETRFPESVQLASLRR